MTTHVSMPGFCSTELFMPRIWQHKQLTGCCIALLIKHELILQPNPDQHACDGVGMVEVWLQKLVDGMQGTVKNTIKRAYRNVQEMALEDFIFGHPAQIALLGIQFQWTADTQVSYA